MKQLCILLLHLVFLSTSHACDCWGPAFCEIVHSVDSFWNEGYLVQAVKIKDVEHGMELEVIKDYGRNPITSEFITVWGDLGWLCREYTSNFIDGDTVILNLLKIGEFPITDSEDPEDFQLSFCGVNYLKVENGQVRGGIYDFEERIVNLKEFELVVLTDNYCDNITATNSSNPNKLEIYPNPFTHYFRIEAEQSISELRVIDVMGRTVFSSIDNNRKVLRLNTSTYSDGTYFVKIIFRDRSAHVVKLIKSH